MLTEEQRLARKDRVTASAVGAILGVSPYATPNDVMREMVREHFGAEREFMGNVATQWGEDHESDAILTLESTEGVFVERCGLIVHPDHDWLGASPDGLVGSDRVVEVKAPYNRKLFSLSDRPDYAAQIITQMACSGRPEGWFAVWTPDDFHAELVCFNPDWFNASLPVLQTFYDSYIAIIADPALAEPYLADLVQDMEDDAEWAEQANDYRIAMADLKELQDRIAEHKAKLVELADGRTSQGHGVMVYPIKGRTTTDYKAAINDNCPDVDLEKYQKSGPPSWGIKSSKGE